MRNQIIKDVFLGLSIALLIFFCWVVAVKYKQERERRNEWVVELIYTNGDKSEITVIGPRPKVVSNGCVYDGFSYVCGVRCITSISEK